MARSDPRIRYSDLRAKALSEGLSDEEISRYFEVDQKAAERLEFSVKLNPTTVRQDGKRPTRLEVNELLRKVGEDRQTHETEIEPSAPSAGNGGTIARSSPTARSLGPPARPKILNEGDSWFNLPIVLKPQDAMDYLRRWFNIYPLAKWSAKLADIVRDKQYVTVLNAGTGYDMFMFSAGGNDVLASLAKCLNQRKPGDTDPANAASYVNSEFIKALNRAMTLYEEMVADIRATPSGPGVTIILHGYSNAVPRKNGKYLGRHLQAKGFDPVTHKALCKAIISHMIGQFNARLETLAIDNMPAVFVDLRSTVTDADWSTDEIHPSSAGAEKVANKFRTEINAGWPNA